MNKIKLSCTMIVRNEAATLRACLASIRPHVDELVIVDTGSTDDSPSIAKAVADRWEQTIEFNWPEPGGLISDFAAARNYALSLATGDAVCWFDGDDTVRGAENLRKLVSEAYTRTAGQPFAWLAPYEYERDKSGRVITLQTRERLVYPRSGWEWRTPVHEGLLGKAGTVATYLPTDALVVQHDCSGAKPRVRDRNLRILEAYIRKTGETDPRSLHYYAAELMLNGRIGEALHWFKRHNVLAPWSDERALSLMHIGRVAFAMGDYGEAVRWALEATTTKAWPEPHWLIGMSYCELAQRGIDVDHNYRRAAHFLQRGFELDKAGGGESLLMKDPTARYDAHSYYAPVLERLGRFEEAIKSAEAGVAGKPENKALAEGLAGMRRMKLQAEIIEADKRGDVPHLAAVGMVKLLRGEMKIEQAPVALDKTTATPSGHFSWSKGKTSTGKLRIAFYLGHQLEPWTPETLERNGMGGSETMAWEISKRLAKLGHSVHVFGHMPKGTVSQEFEGVEWRDADSFPDCRLVKWDVLIVSRQSEAVRLPHTAKARVLWVHDVHCGPGFTPEVAIKYDFIWCLSNWHKEHFCSVYPWLNPDKVEVTRNGIDVRRFVRTSETSGEGRHMVARVAHRAVYSSSSDRGLEAAVRAWPAVRAAIPDAELHCYYGFENWERSIELNGDTGHEHCGYEALVRLKKLVAETPGVVMHGRVNQRELAEAMLGAGVWFYPTWFSETSCITAMEAQMAGLWCHCPELAALAETVRCRFEPTAADIIKSMKCSEDARSVNSMNNAERFSLDTLAESWQARLNKLATDATENVVPKFFEAAAQ